VADAGRSRRGPPAASTRLPPRPSSAAEARAFVRQFLTANERVGDEEVAVLLTSEVVSNAILHAATDVDVGVSLTPAGAVRVEVRDSAAGLPAVRAIDAEDTGGRGLFLVDALARRWGTEPSSGGGKVVWFEVDAETAAGAVARTTGAVGG